MKETQPSFTRMIFWIDNDASSQSSSTILNSLLYLIHALLSTCQIDALPPARCQRSCRLPDFLVSDFDRSRWSSWPVLEGDWKKWLVIQFVLVNYICLIRPMPLLEQLTPPTNFRESTLWHLSQCTDSVRTGSGITTRKNRHTEAKLSWGRLNIKMPSSECGVPVAKRRWSWGCFIFTMGIHLIGTVLGPWKCYR